jgi:hypothetical protein
MAQCVAASRQIIPLTRVSAASKRANTSLKVESEKREREFIAANRHQTSDNINKNKAMPFFLPLL